MLAIETYNVAAELLPQGLTRKAVANRSGASIDQVDRIAKGLKPVLGCKPKSIPQPRERESRPLRASRLLKPRYLPTLEEIAQACRRLQETWDDLEYLKRANWHVTNITSTDEPPNWEVPLYSMKDLAA